MGTACAWGLGEDRDGVGDKHGHGDDAGIRMGIVQEWGQERGCHSRRDGDRDRHGGRGGDGDRHGTGMVTGMGMGTGVVPAASVCPHVSLCPYGSAGPRASVCPEEVCVSLWVHVSPQACPSASAPMDSCDPSISPRVPMGPRIPTSTGASLCVPLCPGSRCFQSAPTSLSVPVRPHESGGSQSLSVVPDVHSLPLCVHVS